MGVSRYTDFLVNEILPSGKVLHLENLQVPRNKQGGEQDGKAESSADHAKPAQPARELKKEVHEKEPTTKDAPVAKEEEKEDVSQVGLTPVPRELLMLMAYLLPDPGRRRCNIEVDIRRQNHLLYPLITQSSHQKPRTKSQRLQ